MDNMQQVLIQYFKFKHIGRLYMVLEHTQEKKITSIFFLVKLFFFFFLIKILAPQLISNEAPCPLERFSVQTFL